MTGQPEHVVVVGAGLGGLRTVQQLRSAGFQGRLSLVGAEPHVPYDRPPLSKQLLTGTWETDRVLLTDPAALDDLGVRTHLGLPAVGLHTEGGPGRAGHELELADGATLHGDAVVIATGLTARRLPGQPDGVHTLRTLEDSLTLRDALAAAGSLLVVGGGFIGAEVASAARSREIDVTVLEALPVPAARALGSELGGLAARLMSEAGVELRTDAAISGFVTGGDGVGVELADGAVVRADAGIVGIGGAPRLDWLKELPPAALAETGGLHCSATGRVHGLHGVWAVGDVASWDDPEDGGPHRHEHWTSACDQAAVVAHDILRAPPPASTVPYFWSDQFGLKIQLIGRPELAEAGAADAGAADAGGIVPLHGKGLDGGPVRGTVAGYIADDRLVAVAGFGAARYVVRYRPLVAARATRKSALEMAASLG